MVTEMKRLMDNMPCDEYGKELNNFLSTKSGIEKTEIIKLFTRMKEPTDFESALTQLIHK
jgi:hypothetical protein